MAGETKSYRDRLLGRAQRFQEQLAQERPDSLQVDDAYRGFYMVVEPPDKAASANLNSGATGVGEVLLLADGNLYTQNDQLLAPLPADQLAKVKAAQLQGLTWHFAVATIYYVGSTHLLTAEVAACAWKQEVDAAFAPYFKNQRFRMAGGEHPRLRLSQQEFDKVRASGGTWYLTKQQARPKLATGTVYFRRKSAAVDKVAKSATKHKVLWTFIACLFWLLVIAAIAFFVWWFFFSKS
jgi:hypothetical protein